MYITVSGASEHNLRDVDVQFGDGLTVVTGVSGSGKTSLVFDTLYHEARRRFLDVFALGSTNLRLAPAKVRCIDGLGPAVAVGQNLLNRNPNSTLSSATGIHLFLRVLYARFGERRCPDCGLHLAVLGEDEMVGRILALRRHGTLRLYAPLLHRVPGSHGTLLRLLAEQFGADRLLVDGSPWQSQALTATKPHDLEVHVATLTSRDGPRRAREAVQMVSALGSHSVTLRTGACEWTLSQAPVCPDCGSWLRELRPVHFGTPCPHCGGEGCERCARTGLHPQASAVRLNGLRLPELLALSVEEAHALFTSRQLPTGADRLRSEILRRLEALSSLGLGYVGLDRSSPSLSRGEAQRVRLALALTSRLEDLVHVLDEPTIGQHPADVARLMPALRRLAGPVVYVEHDRLAASLADRAVDLGPGAGAEGGRLLFSGTPAALWQADTPTGRFFSLRERTAPPARRAGPDEFLTIRGGHLRNLQDVDVPIPLGRLVVITGVSGSGKSTLVEDVLVATLSSGKPVGCRSLAGPWLSAVMVDQSPIGRNPRSNPATYTKLSDVVRELYSAATGLSASHFSFNRPEGACPACRGMGAVEVQMRYLPSTWIPCAACTGRRFSDEVLGATVKLGDREYSISDLYGLEIHQALSLLSADPRLEAGSRRRALRILEALRDVGLGYLTLGQPSPTLSGGEAQRLKLARHLARGGLSNKLLVLDEPTTGLHPQDVSSLLTVLDRLVRQGATVVVVEHNADIIRAADWVIDLGPGAGPAGGRLLYAGSPEGLVSQTGSLTASALAEEELVQPLAAESAAAGASSHSISIRGAHAHNLRDVDVDFPKKAFTVVTGVSGSGKSSLVKDVLEVEARRRFLETLSLYERQATQEGSEALVESVKGMGVAIPVGTERRLRYDWRATVGSATEVSRHLAVLLSLIGERRCTECGSQMVRTPYVRESGAHQSAARWACTTCGAKAPVASPRHFSAMTYAAACLTCHGVGHMQEPRPEKLIIHPDKPLCGGALYSPGFFPKGYLCKPFNSGYDMTLALGQRYSFDPEVTPWSEMTSEARQAFLFGDPEPMDVSFRSRTRTSVQAASYPGFYGWIRDWDVGGLYTERVTCPDCQGQRLRPEFLAVALGRHNMHKMSELPLCELQELVLSIGPADSAKGESESWSLAANSLRAIQERLHFLVSLGLGYLHLSRLAGSLSAGEAQRIRLAGLLGSGLSSLTALLDEPSRGMHPSELEALRDVLLRLRDEGNTVIVVEHDPVLIRAADHVVDMGPGPGVDGGKVVAQGSPAEVSASDTVTGAWLRAERCYDLHRSRRPPSGWLEIRGARAHNLRGDTARFPLGALVGVCGVSGSGKSTLVIDTLGRALAPRRLTTSVAYAPIDPGVHDSILGAPARTVVVDQALVGVTSPASYLKLSTALRRLYAQTDAAEALGLSEKDLGRTCSSCGGRGSIRLDMGFLPAVNEECETCHGTGLPAEAWEIRLRGFSLPEAFSMTIDEVAQRFGDVEALQRRLEAAQAVGLGYLVLRQPRHALSGGEAQRLKIALELSRRVRSGTLYILDEPTVGQHLEDVRRLVSVLHGLVDRGHTVLVVEHHPQLLASCDWLVELGPVGGPGGGSIIAEGPPERVAAGQTPTARYLRDVLERAP